MTEELVFEKLRQLQIKLNKSKQSIQLLYVYLILIRFHNIYNLSIEKTFKIEIKTLF